MTPTASSPNPSWFSRRTASSYLTKIAHGTSPFIATFLLIHLSAPALSNLGGSPLASQVMLLGREYYQTPFGETYLVKAPIIVHSLASIAKRIISPPKTPPRPLSSIITLTGYGTLLLFLPIHYFTHRVYPSFPSGPIFAVGPAELDYEFVKVGLEIFPGRAWGLYLGLILCVAVHSAEGMNIIWNMRFKSQLGSLRKRTWRLVAAAGALPVLSGLYVLSQEPLMIFASLSERFQAAFAQSWVYRL